VIGCTFPIPRVAPVTKTFLPAALLSRFDGEMAGYILRCIVGVSWYARVMESISAWVGIVTAF
jgi:hypothetical protein